MFGKVHVTLFTPEQPGTRRADASAVEWFFLAVWCKACVDGAQAILIPVQRSPALGFTAVISFKHHENVLPRNHSFQMTPRYTEHRLLEKQP